MIVLISIGVASILILGGEESNTPAMQVIEEDGPTVFEK
jgi:hypothetical protein